MQALVENADMGDIEATTSTISRPIPRCRLDGMDEQIASANNQGGKPYIYSKALIFYPNTSLTPVDIAFYSSVVVFNLVLTSHRKSSNLRERDLAKLLALYDLVLQLISASTRTGKYDSSHLVLATLNNKSVVHSELGQHRVARQVLYYVWDVLRTPVRRPRILDPWEIEGISLNIFLMMVNAPNVAEAA